MKHQAIIATSTTLTASKNNIQLTTTIATIKDPHMSHTNSNKNVKKKGSTASTTTKKGSGSSNNHSNATTRNNNNNKEKEKEKDDIWTSTNYTEERQRIREFWLQLSETERRSLVKVEKEAVLRKMKEQQRHSCNCSVCGKKRNAIEDELEVLYDAYYEELEQYAFRQQQQQQLQKFHDQGRTSFVRGNVHVIRSGTATKKQLQQQQKELLQQQQKDAPRVNLDNDELVELSNTLTVKGSIITVADDLLKNDGKKFLDMMEKLNERKMSKEREVINTFNKHHHHHHHKHRNHSSSSTRSLDNTDDEEDSQEDEEDEEEEDDEEDEDDEDEESEEEDSRTEEQRMEEGRKMFQVFAARMFEQRVLTAYREKVAQDRQKRLIEELEEEDRQRQERELKKQQEKEKKKEQKRQLKLQQEQERLELENKKKQEELAAKADRERKRQLANQLKEQERLKKEEEKRHKQEERLRKEEEKKKRLLAQQQAAAEKKRKEEEEVALALAQAAEEEVRKKKSAEEEAEAKRKAEEEEEEVRKAAEKAEAEAHLKAQQEAAEREAAALKRRAAAVMEEKENSNTITSNIPTQQSHHVLTDSKTSITPIGQRRTSLAGPIGSSVRSRSIGNQFDSVQATESQNSFFSNFLFGQPTIREHHDESANSPFNVNRRVSFPAQQHHTSDNRWSNGWTPLTALSDNVHGKLFGDVLAASDRNTLILERARLAYFKLDEIAQNKYFMIPSFHTLEQVHRMIHEMYFDLSIDLRELYDCLSGASGQLKCHYHQTQQCYIVSNMPTTSSSSLLSGVGSNSNLLVGSPPPPPALSHQVPGHHAL